MWRLKPQIKAQNRKYRMHHRLHHVLRVPGGSEKGNVITHDRRLLKTTEATTSQNDVTGWGKKDPKFPLTCFSLHPSLVFAPKYLRNVGKANRIPS